MYDRADRAAAHLDGAGRREGEERRHFNCMHSLSASRKVDDDAEPGGFDLPVYTKEQAQHEEENGTTMTMSDGEVTSAEADRRDAERRARPAAGRRRFVLDEADEEEEEEAQFL